MKRKLFISFLFLISFTWSFSQKGEDTTFLSAAIQNSIGLYQKAIGGQAKLYNGSKYQAPEHAVDEHPYFFSDDWIMGDVFYDDEWFGNVPLMFDLHSGQLIAEHLSSGHPIRLVNEKLSHFSLAGHTFEKIVNESVGGSLPLTTFYDILYPGETKVIAWYQKFVRDLIESHDIVRTFEARTRYFIFKNGVFFPVKSKASVLKILSDKKKDLKKFLKANRIQFSDNRESAMKKLAGFYDTLRNQEEKP